MNGKPISLNWKRRVLWLLLWGALGATGGMVILRVARADDASAWLLASLAALLGAAAAIVRQSLDTDERQD